MAKPKKKAVKKGKRRHEPSVYLLLNHSDESFTEGSKGTIIDAIEDHLRDDCSNPDELSVFAWDEVRKAWVSWGMNVERDPKVSLFGTI